MTDKQSESIVQPRTTTTTIKFGSERLAQLYPHVSDDTPLPSKWNSKDKAPTLVLQQNNLVVTYKGPGKSHKDAASIRADHPIPPLTGIYYYEVTILSKGRDGYMGIGLSTKEVNLNRLPGWDKGSYGYHGDDGHSFCSSGSGVAYGPTFTTGDTVGCCVNFVENSCFYTRNGYNIGTSFRDIPNEVYPTVGLQTPMEAIEANFGLNSFKFDFDKYIDEYREKTRRSILDCTLKENELLHRTQLRRIVSTYLVHYGFCATAEQFNKHVESVFADELNSMRNRQLIQQLILDGRTTDAIEKTKELFPSLLNDKNLLFALKVRQLIEMINGTESETKHSSHLSTSKQTNKTTSPFKSGSHQNSNGTTPTPSNNPMEVDDEQYLMNGLTNGHALIDGDGHTMEVEHNHDHRNDQDDEDYPLLGRILQFGRELHTLKQQLTLEYGENPQNDKMLQDAFSLLAYPDAKLSPLAHLLEPSQRETVSNILNSAILEAHDMPRHPALEVLVGYLGECDKLMHKNHIPDCAFIDLNKYLR